MTIEKIERLRIGFDRYETARRMNTRDWNDAQITSLVTGKPFDEIIDELGEVMFAKKAP